MKSLIALISVFSFQAFASNNIDAICKVSDRTFIQATGVNTIFVEDVLSEDAAANFPDAAKFNQTVWSRGKVTLIYSNEFDNYYSISFSEAAVNRAHEVGQVRTRAEVEFSNPETSPEGGENPQLISVSCVLQD
jgi:hypothetical protein